MDRWREEVITGLLYSHQLQFVTSGYILAHVFSLSLLPPVLLAFARPSAPAQSATNLGCW